MDELRLWIMLWESSMAKANEGFGYSPDPAFDAGALFAMKRVLRKIAELEPFDPFEQFVNEVMED